MKTNGLMKISRRQLLTSAAAGALVPELAGFEAFSVHSGSTTPPGEHDRASGGDARRHDAPDRCL